jgi:excisionase family DNA binding protein
VTQPLTLTIREVCARLGVSRSLVYGLFETGELKRLDLGKRCVRIPRESFEAYWQCKNGGLESTGESLAPSEETAAADAAARSMAQQASLARTLRKQSQPSRS